MKKFFQKLLRRKKRQADVYSTTEALDYANKILTRASQYGLEPEVTVWALQEMKNDPKLSIEQALHMGAYEWDV